MLHESIGSEQVGVETTHPEFVPVIFASELKQARRIKQLLEQNNIPAMLDHDLSGEAAYTILPRGIGVLVPDQMHTAASEIVASDEDQVEVDDEDVFDSDLDEGDVPVDDDLDEEELTGDDDDDLTDLDDLDDEYDTDDGLDDGEMD